MSRQGNNRAEHLWRVAITLGACVFASACTLPVSPWSAGSNGAQLYAEACAACHGSSGHGDGPVASALTTRPPDLTQLTQTHGGRFPRDLVIATLSGELDVPAHGTRDMPAWSQRFGAGGAPGVAAVYARRNLEQLTDYLASIQKVESR